MNYSIESNWLIIHVAGQKRASYDDHMEWKKSGK